MKFSKQRRLPEYDYNSNGYYFVTICTKNRIPWFGHIEDEHMVLFEKGKIVQECWDEIPTHFPNIQLDEFIVMPDHVHGIIIIDTDPFIPVGAADLRHLQQGDRTKMLIPKVIQGWKSTVSRRINNPSFAWQRSYYDHIIRNETALYNIRVYIQNNPLQWQLDQEYPENLDFLSS